MIKAVAKKLIAQEYPHVKLPAVVFATVSKAAQLGETFELEELVIHNDETGSSYKGHITAHWNEYTLTVVDRFGNVDETFPALPGVRSKAQYKAGAVVAVGMFRELGPVITGLMLAGRVGSAMAAEIGTMKVTEQVDALKSMNVDPVDYLVKPRIQAMLISMPILMMEAVLVGIASAYIVSVTAFNVDQAYWMHFMSKFVTMGDIIVALVKALVFGLIISTISCREGLNTTNGAVGVGKSTMQAMVYASVALLIANFILTMILNSFFPMGFMR